MSSLIILFLAHSIPQSDIWTTFRTEILAISHLDLSGFNPEKT